MGCDPASADRGDSDIASSYDGIGAPDGEGRAGIEIGWVVERYAGAGRLLAGGTGRLVAADLVAIVASLARRGEDGPADLDEAEFNSLMPGNMGSGRATCGNIGATGVTESLEVASPFKRNDVKVMPTTVTATSRW